jgi:acetolactate synthase small subunit
VSNLGKLYDVSLTSALDILSKMRLQRARLVWAINTLRNVDVDVDSLTTEELTKLNDKIDNIIKEAEEKNVQL